MASGPRHQGLLENIFSTVQSLELCTARLQSLRQEKQFGNPHPSKMEVAVKAISQKCAQHGQNIWDVMNEMVDMENEGERAMWVRKKEKALKYVTEWMLKYLERLDRGEQRWKEREVGIMRKAWATRWEAYGKMNIEDQKAAGWILDVEK